MKRVLLIANKKWEVEPILSALLDETIRSPKLVNPSMLNYPMTYAQGAIAPRAVWNNYPSLQLELWCIQDILAPNWDPSSSQGKHEDLPKILPFSPEEPTLVIALGTGASGSETINQNGCVIVGSNVFIHNFHPASSPNPKSIWDDPVRFNQLIPSSISPGFFDSVNTAAKSAVPSLLRPYMHPAKEIQVFADIDYMTVSTVNVTNYLDYPKSDPASIRAVKKAGVTKPVGSVETTYGIVRLLTEAPFVFINGVPNRYLKTKTDLNGKDSLGNTKTTAQNYTAAFNAGVLLAWLIPEISGFLGL
jgi:hypothetical protein